MRLLSSGGMKRRARRDYGIASGQLSQGFQQARTGLNETLAARGMQGSGAGLAAGAALPFQEAQARNQLQAASRQQYQMTAQAARQQAMDFLNQILQMRLGARGMSEQIRAAQQAQPTGFQQVLGDISGVANVLGSLGKTAAGFGMF